MDVDNSPQTERCMDSNNGSLLGSFSIRTENLLLLRLTTTTAGSSAFLSLGSLRRSILLLLGSLSSGLLGSLGSFLDSLRFIFLSFGSSLGGFDSFLLSCDLSLLGFLVLGELFGTPVSLLGPFCSAE